MLSAIKNISSKQFQSLMKRSFAAVIGNKENFKEEVLESDIPVILDFYAEWCGPCKQLLPTIEALTDGEYEGKVKFVKVDIDHQFDLVEQYGVSAVPSVFGIVDGETKGHFLGAKSTEEVKDWIDETLI